MVVLPVPGLPSSRYTCPGVRPPAKMSSNPSTPVRALLTGSDLMVMTVRSHLAHALESLDWDGRQHFAERILLNGYSGVGNCFRCRRYAALILGGRTSREGEAVVEQYGVPVRPD